MTQPTAITVPPSIPRSLGKLVMANLCFAAVLLVTFGLGTIMALASAVIGGLSVICFVIMVVSRRPRVVITSEGFAFQNLFGGGPSHKWEDMDGQFAVIKFGWGKAVAYKLTEDYKARVGKKPPSLRFLGYDNVVVGAFQLSAEELAELLNHHKRNSLAHSSDEATCAVALAQEAQAKGNGSLTLRVTAGVLALLFAAIPAFAAADGKLALGDLAWMEALALMFGWYAVRGRKGLPRFLTKKLGG